MYLTWVWENTPMKKVCELKYLGNLLKSWHGEMWGTTEVLEVTVYRERWISKGEGRWLRMGRKCNPTMLWARWRSRRYQREDVELVQMLSRPIHEDMESIESTIVFWIVMPLFQRNILPLSAESRSRQQTFFLLHACWLLAVHFSEISQNYWATQCHISEDGTLHSDCGEERLEYNGELEFVCSQLLLQWNSSVG
jgi:hypothetical protein